MQGVLEEEYRAPMPWQNGDVALRYFSRRAIAMRRDLTPLRRGDSRAFCALPGFKLLVFSWSFSGETVTMALNCSPDRAELLAMPDTAYWAEGFEQQELSAFGFAVLVNGRG